MAASLDYGGKQMDPAYMACAPGRDVADVAVPLLQVNTLPGGGDARTTSLQRSLDRELVPLARAAALSAAAYEEPTDPVDLAQVGSALLCIVSVLITIVARVCFSAVYEGLHQPSCS